MTALPKIKQLEYVIELPDKASVLSYESSNLAEPGDNYGSILLAIEVKLQRPNGELFTQQLVAKVPPTDANYWRFIQPERTCLSEIAIYKYLAPALATLEQEAAQSPYDGLARYYGSRTSLRADAKIVDHDAVLLLENLKACGYVPGQRLRPLDLAHTQLALRYMAQFHAIPLALRLLKPHVFASQIRPYFNKFDWHAKAPESKATMIAETLEDIRLATNNDDTMVRRVQQLSDRFFEFLSGPDVSDGPFTSIIHSDFWTCNLMFKYAPDGTPKQLKIIDFQTAQYESVVHDIIAFLLSSVDTVILEQHYDQLLQHYYENFISTLRSLQIQMTPAYSFTSFQLELKRVAFIQVPHAIFMTRFILADSKDQGLGLTELLTNTSSNRVRLKLNEILRLAHKFGIL